MVLTKRQMSAIPLIVAAPTYTEGCKQAKIAHSTFYTWLNQQEFKDELEKQQAKAVERAFQILEQNIARAVEGLVCLLDTEDEKLRRQVCNDIIHHYMQHKEYQELAERIEAIEEELTRKP